jgi:hypothetical protein
MMVPREILRLDLAFRGQIGAVFFSETGVRAPWRVGAKTRSPTQRVLRRGEDT